MSSFQIITYLLFQCISYIKQAVLFPIALNINLEKKKSAQIFSYLLSSYIFKNI